MAQVQQRWQAAWPQALACWSRFTQLHDPQYCVIEKEEKDAGMASSFAMIRLNDHTVVISLRKICDQGLSDLALPILAHEIGHHVYAPGDLREHARMMVRVQRVLANKKALAGMVCNLYTDLLLNDRLQRQAGVNIVEVYRRLHAKSTASSPLWALYMRGYELLWSLPTGSLGGSTRADIQADAPLLARLIRVYARDPVLGVSRFAALVLPYLEDPPPGMMTGWMDAADGCTGGEMPDGMSDMDPDEFGDILHPAEDPEITGIAKPSPKDDGKAKPFSNADTREYSRKPSDYSALAKSLGVNLPVEELIARFYRERSSPHLIPFPTRPLQKASDPQPEGLDIWDVGAPLSGVDWTQSLMRSPVLIPGYTLVERQYGTTEGQQTAREAPDLYLGVDCSGSMPNPAQQHSWPVLAGTVILRSALRAGAAVKVTLSGESPGKHVSTPGFVRQEMTALKVLTGYLGTGYAFGIMRLKDTFMDGPPLRRPTHILLITDSDLFAMLDRTEKGWEIAAEALKRAGGGGTLALNLDPKRYPVPLDRLRAMGWEIHPVSDLSGLLAFARSFARRRYAPGVPCPS